MIKCRRMNGAQFNVLWLAFLLLFAVSLFVTSSVNSDDARPNQTRDAVRKGNLDLVRSLIAEKPELANTPDSDLDSHYPPLHWAVIDGQVEIARLLLEKGAKVNAREERNGMTPIFHARSVEMVKLLLEYGADFKLTAKDTNRTPLREALDHREFEVVKFYVARGEKLDFDAAVEMGQTELVATMLREKPWLAKPPRKPLHSPAGQGNLELCKLLIEHGADPNLDYGFVNVAGPYTPLTDAVTRGHYEIASLLMEHNANPNVSGGRNHSNLFLFAIAYLDARFVKLMLEHGADVHIEDDWQHTTPLHVAAALGGADDAGYVSRWGQPDALEKEKLEVMEKVKLLLEFGADVNAHTDDGATALLFAAIAGHRQVCDLLLQKGAKLDIYSACLLGKKAEAEEMLKMNPALATAKQHPLRRPLLHWSAHTGDGALVRRLLELGANPNVKAPEITFQDAGGFSVWEQDDSEGPTALHIAARHSHEEIARVLIEQGAAVEAKAAHDSTPLYYACSGGHEKVVKLLLEKGAKAASDEPALMAACETDAVLKLLLDALDRKDLADQLGVRLLAAAAHSENKGAVDLVLARGAKPDIFTACVLGRVNDVRTLLERNPSLVNAIQSDYPKRHLIEIAIEKGHAEMVELLITKGAEILPTKLGGISLLHAAARHGNQKVIDLLIDRGLKLETRDDEGATLLHSAASGGQPEIVRFLLSKGADAQAVDFSRETPLHAVTDWGLSEREQTDPKLIERTVGSARQLIQAGGDVNAKDKNGWTPLHGAAFYGYVEIAELLIGAGADVNARNHRNETPLSRSQRDKSFGFSGRDTKTVADLLRQHGGVR